MIDDLFERNRYKVLDAFDPLTGAYSHVTPYQQNHFIDGMAWVSLLAGAARLYGDVKVEAKCVQYLNTLTFLGNIHYGDPLALRSFGPGPISNRWNHHGKHYTLKKPQAFAGPAAYCWARDQGCKFDETGIEKPKMTGLFTNKLFSTIFGYAATWISPLRQHINSVMLAHLLEDDKPPKSLRYYSQNNPFYSVITGEDYYTYAFPPNYDLEGGRVVDSEAPTAFDRRAPGPWPGKNHVTSLYTYDIPMVPVGNPYTPSCWLFCYYMHHKK